MEACAREVLSGIQVPGEGLMGPDSKIWQVVGESICFMGSWRASLLQLAHPWVAHAIDHYSIDTRSYPMRRFHRTFQIVWGMVFGDAEHALATARKMWRIHDGIRGRLSEKEGVYTENSDYRANEVSALLWVHATLWESAIVMYETFVRKLSPAELEQFYTEAKRFAALFGIPERSQPENWQHFMEYNRQMWDSQTLHVGLTGRRLCRHLFDLKLTGARHLLPWFEEFTASTLPERLARDFQLRPVSPRVEKGIRLIRRGYPLIPSALRRVPAWHEARLRLRHRPPPLWLRLLSRGWLGIDSSSPYRSDRASQKKS